jgi:hypothetical protein
MKVRFSFVLCSVLIYCIASCPRVAASDESSSDESKSDSDEEFRECSGQYLKSKGLLDIEVTSSKQASMCLFGMNFALRALRDVIENKVKKEIPNEATCVMNEFDKAEILDFIIKIGYIQASENVPEDERKISLAAMENLGDEKLKVIATTCGVDSEKLEEIFDNGFDSSEEEADSPAKTETA